MSVAALAPDALMDRIYRHQRHIYDLTRRFYLLGRDDLIGALAPGDGGTVLEIGCGTGRNLIVAARRYPRARLFGIDVSAAMLATARANIARAGLSDRIMLAQADATAFDPAALFATARFDRVFFSYCLSMIPPWHAALARAADRVAPGGSLHVVDFGQQARLPRAFRTMLFAWLAAFHVTPRSELDAELAALAASHGARLETRRLRRDYARLHALRFDAAPTRR